MLSLRHCSKREFYEPGIKGFTTPVSDLTEQQLLALPDEELFAGGGCHVFADELYKSLAPVGFTLRRMADTLSAIRQSQAIHVYVGRADVMIDVKGCHDESDYFRKKEEWYRRQHYPQPKYEGFECSSEELFTHFKLRHDSELGIVNRWNLRIGEDFVEKCRRRARALISQRPDKYQLTD